MDEKEEIEKLRADCSTLEEQVKLLVETESNLRKTHAELTESRRKVEEYSRTLEQKVAEKTEELQAKMEQLKRVNKLMVGRELRMKELKKEIAVLREKYEGRPFRPDKDEAMAPLN